MGFFIDDSEPVSSATVAPSGFFLDEAADVAPAPESSAYDYIMGGLKGVAKAGSDIVTAPADLLFRGGNYLIDKAAGTDTNLEGSYPSDYRDKFLEFMSGGDGDQTTEDITQAVGNIGTVIANPSQAQNIASKIPLLSKAAGSSKLANLGAKAVGYGTEGAGYGALFNTKSEDLGGDMLQGAALNVAIPSLFNLAGKGAKAISSKFANAADETLERGLGVQYGDRTKGLNRVNLFVNEAGETVPLDKLDDAIGIQAPIQQQIKILDDAGILASAPNDVQALKLHITKAQKEVGKTIPALAKEADQVIGGKEILPEFESTYKFLQGYRDSTRTGLVKEFDGIIDDYISMPGSGLQKLNKFTDQLQKETSFESAIPAAQTKLKRMISYDLRKAAEREFDAALPGKAGEFAKANQIYSAAENIGKTLNKPLARQAPSIGDYIKGGSLPMTVGTGLVTAPAGIAIAAPAVAAKIGAKAVQQYTEAAYPLSVSRFYKGLASKADAAKTLTDKAIDASRVSPFLLGNSQSPERDDLESAPLEQKQMQGQRPELTSQSLFNTSKSSSSLFNTGRKGSSLFDVPGNSNASQGDENLMKKQDVALIDEGKFINKVDTIAKDLGASPDHLLAVMNFETGGTFNPSEKNKAGSGATGLIQFMPATAKELTGEKTKEAAINLMASMTPTDQLDYVQKYLAPFKGKLKTLDDVYMAVLYPKAVGKDNSYALFKEGTTAYWQNRGLDIDKDGVITKSEATKKVEAFSV